MEVIDIQAVRDCLAEVSDCEDKQYALALLEWAIGKRTFDLEEHDTKLLDKVAEKIREHSGMHYVDCDGYFGGEEELIFKVDIWLDDIIKDLKAEVNE